MISSQISSIFSILLLELFCVSVLSGLDWEKWWTYDGISGPDYWGRYNLEWALCSKGARQSPINLEPNKLLFDPNLNPFFVDKHRIDGKVMNTGHGVIFKAGNVSHVYVNITGGPLSYRYRFHEIHLHFGLDDRKGSEHSINGYAFPAELQIFGFNSYLYQNFSEALYKAQGIVAISLLLQVGERSNPELGRLTNQIDEIKYRDKEMDVKQLSVAGLLPETEYYITYDGSITTPPCYETVTWLVLNKPIYVTKQQLHALRSLLQGTRAEPPAPLGNNFRPIQFLHHRPLRTNIDFTVKKDKDDSCRPSMYKEVYYKANSWEPH